MFRFTASALAVVAAISLMPLATSEAGNRTERHRINKTDVSRLTFSSGSRHRHHDRRIVIRNVAVVKAVVKVDTQHDRSHPRSRAYGIYSGSVDIYSQNGVGQWSYGSGGGYDVAVTVAPNAKIIDVATLKPNSACEMQAGVCVIKP